MRYALYEDPRSHRFAFVAIPNRLAEDDALPIPATTHWFDSREEAVASLPDLLTRAEVDSEGESDAPQTVS